MIARCSRGRSTLRPAIIPIESTAASSARAPIQISSLEPQQSNAFKRADAYFARFMSDRRRQIFERLKDADDGCPNPIPSLDDLEMPTETWVGGTIRVLHSGGFLLQLRDNAVGIYNPNSLCNFGGALRLGESPSGAYMRELREELVGADIFERAYLDILRFQTVKLARGTVVRIVFEMIIPEFPATLRAAEGAGICMIDAHNLMGAPITFLSRDDIILALSGVDANTKYVESLGAFLGSRSFRLDRHVFGRESGEPFDLI